MVNEIFEEYQQNKPLRLEEKLSKKTEKRVTMEVKSYDVGLSKFWLRMHTGLFSYIDCVLNDFSFPKYGTIEVSNVERVVENARLFAKSIEEEGLKVTLIIHGPAKAKATEDKKQ